MNLLAGAGVVERSRSDGDHRAVRPVRDEIERRVRGLLDELGVR